ncbi:MAG TPA: hypothetical protein VIG08_17290 [Gemmatimonadales bacterium]|jgi:hypothetical protein
MTPSDVRGGAGGISAAVGTVASVVVIPDSQMAFSGDQFQVTGQPRSSSGQVLDNTITWTVGNTSVVAIVGAVGQTMTFKAIKVGNSTMKATSGGKSKNSKVVVRGIAGAKVVVTPDQVSVDGGGTVQFTAKGLTKYGETAGVNVTWTSATGTISTAGALTAGNAPGVYRVIAISKFGAADTALVTVNGSPDPVDTIILVPETATISSDETVDFDVYGRTTAGDSVGVTATYTATGGTVAGSGVYTPPATAGTYKVIATSGGIADTSTVTVEVTAPSIAKVTLLPAIAASRPGETTRFAATVFNNAGDSVPQPVTYDATCGTVTGTGVFTAPAGGQSCLVTATSGEKADTTEVVPLTSSPDFGVPFGIYDVWTSGTTTKSTGIAAFSSSHDYIAPGEMANHIAAARAKGMHVVLAMTGGSHDRYKTAGVFDMAKWKAAVDAYNTQAVRDAIAQGVADGTVVGNSVMDEPHQYDGLSPDPTKSWGPIGTMTVARVDTLCGYVKSIFPTLPVGVGHDPAVFQPDSSYHVCTFLLAQLAERKGSVTVWRDLGLARTQRDGMSIIFSMNLINGGAQDKIGIWDCPGTGGLGDRKPNCRMTADQVRDWGKILGKAGCALLSWKYDSAFLARTDNQQAISEVAITLSELSRKSCGGTR